MNERRRNLCAWCGREWPILSLAWDEFKGGQFYACIECKPAAFDVPGARSVRPHLVGGVS